MVLGLGGGAAGRTLALGLALAHSVVSWPAIIPKYSHPYVWRLKRVPWREALRIHPANEYLEAHLNYYRIDQLLEHATEPGATVLTYQGIPEAYTSRRVLLEYESASNHLNALALWTGFPTAWQPSWHRQWTFPRMAVAGVRLVQTNTARSVWSLNELRVLDGAQELPRANWRVTADPCPWDIENAIDNKLVTFWQCGDYLRPGMLVEVTLPQPESADSVLMEAPLSQPNLRLRLDVQDGSGAWKPALLTPADSEVAPPDLRRAAAEELKRRGIDYVLLFDNDVAADDFRRNSDLWRVQLAGEADGARLYRLP
jgi:hypothetical protein